MYSARSMVKLGRGVFNKDGSVKAPTHKRLLGHGLVFVSLLSGLGADSVSVKVLTTTLTIHKRKKRQRSYYYYFLITFCLRRIPRYTNAVSYP